MDAHTILLVPRYAPSVEVLWSTVLPRAIRLDADPAAPGFLDAEMRYRGKPTGGPTVHMPRWTLAHDEASGRILRLTFPASRPEPKMPYDELVDAFSVINTAYASSKNGSEPYRFGLAMSSKIVLEWLEADEEILRAALTPPFAETA